MNRLSLKAWRGNTYLSLAELLLVIGNRILGLKWKLQIREIAPGPGASALESARPEQLIDTLELLHLVSPCIQLIDGEISGYDTDGNLVLRLRAVDSTWWDIETDNTQILGTIKETFSDAIDSAK